MSSQQDLAADNAPRTVDDPHDRARGDTLPAAALTDDPKCLTRENVEAGAIDRLDQPVILKEVGLQVAHGEKGRVGGRRIVAAGEVGSKSRRVDKTARRGDAGVARVPSSVSYHPITHHPITQRYEYGSAASRRPSPRKLKARMTRIT